MSEDDVSYKPLLVKALDDIRGDHEAQVPEDLKESLGWDEIFSTPNITQAIKSMKESAAGQDGLSYAFWVDALELIPERLSKIFKDLCLTGKMTDLMREAVTTLPCRSLSFLVFLPHRGRELLLSLAHPRRGLPSRHCPHPLLCPSVFAPMRLGPAFCVSH